MREQYGIFGVTKDGSLCKLFDEEEFLDEDEAVSFLESNLQAWPDIKIYTVQKILVT